MYPEFEIFVSDLKGGNLVQLTDNDYYDAKIVRKTVLFDIIEFLIVIQTSMSKVYNFVRRFLVLLFCPLYWIVLYFATGLGQKADRQ